MLFMMLRRTQTNIPILTLTLAAAAAFAQNVRITHGPMLGHVTADSIWIWVRTSAPGPFRIRYGLAPDRLDRISEPGVTSEDRDNTGWTRLTGLQPNTRYHYMPVTAGDTGYEGSFLTLPSPGDHRDPVTNPRGLFNFRFEFGSCANQKPGSGSGPNLPAYGTMLKTLPGKIHFSVMNGDWLYEDKREFTVDQWREQVNLRGRALPKILELAPSIAGVWENYKYFLERGANLAAWHRQIPSYYTPDDHELLNDIFGTAEVGRRDRRTVFRDIGMQAWFDYLAGSQPVAYSQPIRFGQARLTAGSDVLEDPTADFIKMDMKQVLNIHVHWGGQYAGVDQGKFPAGDGDPNAGVYQAVEVLDRHRIRIRPAAKATRASVYTLGHTIPFSFNPDSSRAQSVGVINRTTGLESGFDFYKSWNSNGFPRVIAIALQQQTPYFPDSYSVNSANNGPYGDAIIEEVIPQLEQRFRIIAKPYARLVEGASTGGWQTLALQLKHPDFFGGAWVLQPDPIDFRRYQFTNIYQDTNAFTMPAGQFITTERPFRRSLEGQPVWTVRQLSLFEAVLGSKGRSGYQLEAWEAVYGPVGADGYPKPLWDKLTGTIDRDVANYMRENGFDLREYAQRNWATLGPKIVGKLHFLAGDMDDFYLNLAVYQFEDFLKGTSNPHYEAEFTYGRPMKGHAWHAFTWAEMVRRMAAHVKKNAPPGDDTKTWNY